MTAQRLYDLLIEADRSAQPMDLDRCAFLLEAFSDIDWLRTLIKQDAPRLAPLMEPPAKPLDHTRALLRSADYMGEPGYVGQLAEAICHNRAKVLRDGSCEEIVRKPAPAPADPTQATVSTAGDTVAQRLRDLLVVCDAMETDFHLDRLVEVLLPLKADVLDAATLLQDAPRINAALAKCLAPNHAGAHLLRHRPSDTSSQELLQSLRACQRLSEMYGGLLAEVVAALGELFKEHGVQHDTNWREVDQWLRSDRTPKQLQVERRPAKQYVCLYVWMIEHYGGSDYDSIKLERPLVQCSKNWDKELVEKVVQPLVRPQERLQKFVVCVARSRREAVDLAEGLAHDFRIFRKGHLPKQLEARDARYVILLPETERSRAVFVWGKETNWYPPSDGVRFNPVGLMW